MDDRHEVVVTIHKTQSLGPSDLLFEQFQREYLAMIARTFSSANEVRANFTFKDWQCEMDRRGNELLAAKMVGL